MKTDLKPGTIMSLADYIKLPEPRPLARMEQVNTRSHGQIVEVSENYSVWTMENTREDKPRKMWWCCCGSHQVEILDKPIDTKTLPPTSNW